ncbi:MAG TPA: 4Fe-4S dicluster domain-containing protein [Bacteroidota bacterium]|nr:4Fe-4S dicluster domain-containing protein [Bacteroidota bacterium]
METTQKSPRYGMVIDVDRCTGCGNCMVACAVENNVPPAQAKVTERTGMTWMRVSKLDNGLPFPENRSVYLPVSCQQCDHHTPCQSVCPQNAVEYDIESGIVAQIPVRCFGCRYCMTACPYHARYYNWFDPEWADGIERTLNPDVSARMRGVVEKCNFCHGRLQAARAKAAADGRKTESESDYTTACAECCPTQAIRFGNLADPKSEVSILSKSPSAFRLLEDLGTEPKVYFRSEQEWVHTIVKKTSSSELKEHSNG